MLARRLWRLVIAVWIGSWLAITPALLLLRQVVVPGLASLPSGPGEVPAGDVALIVLEAVRGAARPLAFAVLSGLVLMWAWTVLWHAGVVAWTLRADAGGGPASASCSDPAWPRGGATPDSRRPLWSRSRSRERRSGSPCGGAPGERTLHWRNAG